MARRRFERPGRAIAIERPRRVAGAIEDDANVWGRRARRYFARRGGGRRRGRLVVVLRGGGCDLGRAGGVGLRMDPLLSFFRMLMVSLVAIGVCCERGLKGMVEREGVCG